MDQKYIDTIKELINSGDKVNFDLAFELLKSQGVSEEDFLVEHYTYDKSLEVKNYKAFLYGIHFLQHHDKSLKKK